jgi:hypothetical protein
VAISRRERDAFTTFVGFLFETYVLELMQLALTGHAVGHGRVHGEIPYGGGDLSSDVIVDYGEDLLLFEVISRRVPLGVRAEADPDELETHLQRTLLDKIEQLDRVANDVLEARVAIPGVDPAQLRRIWPVLVTAGDLIESEALWQWLRARTAAMTFADERIERLSLLSVEDVEIIAGMVAAGEQVVDIVANKARSPHHELSLARWLLDTRSAPPPRHPEIEARWTRLVENMTAVLGLPDEGVDGSAQALESRHSD